MRIVIVGGVAAGASAAVKARRCNEDAEIILLEKSGFVSFANCGLPYYIGNVIQNREDLILVTPELFRERFNIDVRISHEAFDIDTEAKKLRVKSPDGVITEAYDKLILATGGIPIRPEIPGIHLKNVLNVFTIPDVDRVVATISEGKKTAVVAGGGFIGLETAENLTERGVKTILVEKLPQLMSNMDEEFAGVLAEHLNQNGLELHLNAGLKEIKGSDHVESVILENGIEIPCEMAILAMGVRPNTELARKAGLTIGTAGGICVDSSMLTSDPDIYAAGDAVESIHLVSGKNVRIPLAGSANKQGRVAGACAAGSKLSFKGVLGTSIIKAFDLTMARTGLNEREVKFTGLQYKSVYVPGFSNATYYPGAAPMIMKLTIEASSGKLLGAQAIGYKGIDKRIDVIATAIYSGLTVFDLEDLDLAYAPPYSSAKDPVILGGMISSNMLRGDISYVNRSEVQEMLANGNTELLDVRTEEELLEGKIEGAINIPVDELRKRYRELDQKKNYLIYCAVGYRGYNASLFLNSKGYRTLNLSGGYLAYTMNV